LFYGYATGVFSSRKIERATYKSIPFRFLAGGWHPDHDTIATFRKAFLPEIRDLFAQVLHPKGTRARELGVLKLGNISVDGSKIHADASKSHSVSYGRLLQLEKRLRAEVEELLVLGEKADQGDLPPGLDVTFEIDLRQKRLLNLEQAQAVLEARAQERYEAEQAEYEAKVRAREEAAKHTGRKPRGRGPKPPTPGPRDKDQHNFTDPESRIMKNSTDAGFDQHYNTQAAVDQESRLLVGCHVSNHPTDQAEAIPTVEAIPAEVGKPKAAALDSGYASDDNIRRLEARSIEPYIATGRDHHHRSLREWFAAQPVPPPEDASPMVKMAYKLKTDIGKRIYGRRKSTVEPVIGIIKGSAGLSPILAAWPVGCGGGVVSGVPGIQLEVAACHDRGLRTACFLSWRLQAGKSGRYACQMASASRR
jgi:hypothetical protein